MQEQQAVQQSLSAAEAQAARRLELCERAVKRMLREHLKAAWNEFVECVSCAREKREAMRRVLARCLARVHNRVLADGFARYASIVHALTEQKESEKMRARKSERVARAIARWKAPAVREAFECWLEYAFLQRQMQAQKAVELERDTERQREKEAAEQAALDLVEAAKASTLQECQVELERERAERERERATFQTDSERAEQERAAWLARHRSLEAQLAGVEMTVGDAEGACAAAIAASSTVVAARDAALAAAQHALSRQSELEQQLQDAERDRLDTLALRQSLRAGRTEAEDKGQAQRAQIASLTNELAVVRSELEHASQQHKSALQENEQVSQLQLAEILRLQKQVEEVQGRSRLTGSLLDGEREETAKAQKEAEIWRER